MHQTSRFFPEVRTIEKDQYAYQPKASMKHATLQLVDDYPIRLDENSGVYVRSARLDFASDAVVFNFNIRELVDSVATPQHNNQGPIHWLKCKK